jgi:hypothetical protein
VVFSSTDVYLFEIKVTFERELIPHYNALLSAKRSASVEEKNNALIISGSIRNSQTLIYA